MELTTLQPTYVCSIDERGRSSTGWSRLTAPAARGRQQRFGARNNLFVVSNPVDRPAGARDPLPAREPATFHDRVPLRDARSGSTTRSAPSPWWWPNDPQAKLEIYGRGALRQSVERLIDDLGMADHITLCGWDPRRPRHAVDRHRLLDVERLRGLSAGHAGELEPRLPGGVLRHQVRPARADHRRRRRLPGARQRSAGDGRPRHPDDRRSRPGPPDERRRAGQGQSARLPRLHDAWPDILAKVVANKPKRVDVEVGGTEVHQLGYRPTALPRRAVNRVLQRRFVDRVLPSAAARCRFRIPRIVFDGVVRVRVGSRGGAETGPIHAWRPCRRTPRGDPRCRCR